MWPFKRKKQQQPANAVRCPQCGGTRVVSHSSGEDASGVKTWRGQRMMTLRCLECGKDFYTQEADISTIEHPLIEDEEALRQAEEELKRDTDAGGDRRYQA
jgi:DNA-directed RNA polymerase subunit RPC12/RpoP